MKSKQKTFSYLSTADIEAIVLKQQSDSWKKAGEPENTTDLLNLFNPSNIIADLDYDYQEYENLGENRFHKDRYETAGLVDHDRKIVAVSLRFKPYEQKFTAAHEIGHIWLHPDLEGLHRDRVIGSEKQKNSFDPIEWQANKVATFLLMPKFLILKEVRRRFGKNLPLHFDERISFILNPNPPPSLMSSQKGSLERETAMATYNEGGRIISLVELFGVSVEAMAIRLQELGVVDYRKG